MSPKPSRAFGLTEFEEHIESLLRDRAVDVGRAAIQWNALHERFGIFFSKLFSNETLARRVWHSSNSDRAQRKMLEAAVNEALFERASLRDAVLWALGQADGREEDRNNIIHSPYSPLLDDDGEFRVIPAHHSGHARANKLKGRDLVKDSQAFVENIGALSDYVRQLTTVLSYKKEVLPLPPKPRLPRPAQATTKKRALEK